MTERLPADKSFNIRIGGLPGDVNKDNQISIADVTALVNIILGKDNSEPYQYDHEAADVNGDNTVSIADVTALVNIILGKGPSPTLP
ncbi:MAG: dockerin type I repeat-containing protein [Bacteroidaceae bacterium]|nr:dockerin type I repeat-containing protein [Bacteroidaceae bacterium]